MSSKSGGKEGGQEEARNLVERIEEERQKLVDISLTELSQPEIIERQKAFDTAIIQFMRERLAGETDRED